MSEDQRETLVREAADIFLQLRDDPKNPELQARRDAFCDRGKEEHDAYHELVKTWKASGVMHAPKTLGSIALVLCGLLGLGYFSYDPLRIVLLTDLSSHASPVETTLTSGDIALLDADSALIDKTNGLNRDVTLLEGAAYFDVAIDPRPFTVEIGEVYVTVVGTAFETAHVDDAVTVSVVEGRVTVSHESDVWDLSAGDHFIWSNRGSGSIEARPTADMATWRRDRLIVDGMTLGQAAAIIERRLTGPVVFTSQRLRDTRVTGNLDLANPLVALRLLADTGGGRVYHAPGIGRVIVEK